MTNGWFALLLPLCVSAADLTGSWSFYPLRLGEELPGARLELKSEGRNVTGTLNELKLNGTSEGDRVNIKVARPNGSDWGTIVGTVNGNEMSGSVKREGDAFEWRAKRLAAVSGAPKTHTFEPTQFHRVFSGAIPPALHINPGDTVKTWTVDAGGRDPKGTPRSNGGNPETGPFFIDGALAGDTIVVKFNRIRLNRASAGSGTRIAPVRLGPGYFRDAKYEDGFSGEWTLDLAGNTATLAKATGRLKNFKVQLQPMLGCVGVAPPARQAFRSGWLGSWGGNMEYSGVKEGVTVYLPVYQDGALLFVGDGHALEGDGELNGDALETSMDVEFTVDLIKGKSTNGPRFEDSEWLMASGIAGSLDDALREATTELARWLERDYRLSANESNIVLGTSIRYDIAEVVDPQVHVVAKVRKSVLSTID